MGEGEGNPGHLAWPSEGPRVKAAGWAFAMGSADKPLTAGVQDLTAAGIRAFYPGSKAKSPSQLC